MRTVASNAEETSKRIRAAAIELFARNGFAATGLRELAAEAQLTPAALYHYMGSKEDLLVDIMRSTIEPLDAAARETLAQLETPEEQLGALVELHVWVHGSRPQATLVTDTELRALQGEHRTHVVGIRDRYEALWRETLTRGVEGGRFEVDDVALTAIGLLELCTGVAHWYTTGGKHSLLEVCAMHADWAFGIVRARRDGDFLRRGDLALPPPTERFPLPRD